MFNIKSAFSPGQNALTIVPDHLPIGDVRHIDRVVEIIVDEFYGLRYVRVGKCLRGEPDRRFDE
jgi:hypothetical protein